MTFRSSDLQSDSDLDNIRNSCDLSSGDRSNSSQRCLGLICMFYCWLVEVLDRPITAEDTSEQISDLRNMLCSDWLVHSYIFYPNIIGRSNCDSPLRTSTVHENETKFYFSMCHHRSVVDQIFTLSGRKILSHFITRPWGVAVLNCEYCSQAGFKLVWI